MGRRVAPTSGEGKGSAAAAAGLLDRDPKGTLVLLNIGGMTCAACVGAVERAVRGVSGVTSVSVSLMGKSAKVLFDDGARAPPPLEHGALAAYTRRRHLSPTSTAAPSPIHVTRAPRLLWVRPTGALLPASHLWVARHLWQI